MNSLPVEVMAAIVAFLAAITIGRWFLVNDTLSNRLINRALAWDLVGLLTFVTVGRLGSPDLALDLFAICGAMTAANVLGFAQLLDGAAAGTAVRRQRTYDMVAAAAGCVVLVGTVATPRIGLSVDWGVTVWSLSAVPSIWSGLLITRACARELRTTDTTVKERLTYCALLFIGVYCALASTIALVRTLNGTRPDDQGVVWAIGAYTTLVLLTGLIAIPLFNVLLVQAEWDRAGRCCRRLRPLWRALTTAVPEVVLEPANFGGGAAPRLYRMTVEIQDALMQLKPFVPDAEAQTDIRAYARCMARAARAKVDGASPMVVVSGRATPLALRDRTDELRYLLDLARVWPDAVAQLR